MRAHHRLAALAALILSACGASPTSDERRDHDVVVTDTRDTDPDLPRTEIVAPQRAAGRP